MFIGTVVGYFSMRTVGEILKKARIEKRLTLDEAEKKLRIRQKYLVAIEENAWHKLPSLPYIKGFIRNYSIFLGLKPEEMLAFFRRQFRGQEKTGLLPEGVTKPLNDPLIHWTPRLTIITIVCIFAGLFFGYLFLQYRTLTNPPSLTIDRPQEGEIITAATTPVSGTTDRDSVVSINNQQIAISQDGVFQTTISLTPGVNTIVIESTNTFGKKQTVTRTVQANY